MPRSSPIARDSQNRLAPVRRSFLMEQVSRMFRPCEVASVHGRREAIQWKQVSECPFSDSQSSHASVKTYPFPPEGNP